MSVVTDIRKTVAEATPVMAVVGATDLAVARFRKVAAEAATLPAELESRVSKLQGEVEKAVAALDPDYLQKFLAKAFDPKAIQAGAQQVPAMAISRALEVAGKVETGYETLAERGKKLIGRVEAQKATQGLVRQSRVTLSRSKAAVTTAQRAIGETAEEARATLTIGRKEAGEQVEAVTKAASTGTRGTRAGIKKTATTARKRTTATRTAGKTAATSARKTAKKAGAATESAAKKVGD
jgi:heparin binding hemagglutinin HbhA